MTTRLTVVAMVFVLVIASITPAVAASGVSTSADGVERAGSDPVEESAGEDERERLQTSTAPHIQAQSTTDETTEPSSGERTSLSTETRYVLINTTTSVSHSLQPGAPVADLGVPAGEYLVREYGGQNASTLVDEFTISVNADGDVSRTASRSRVTTTTSHDDDIQVRASVGRDYQGTYAVGKTVTAHRPYPLQAAGFGTDLTLLSLSGEVCAETGRRLKETLAAPVWGAGYANRAG